jgi:hypothetical protein
MTVIYHRKFDQGCGLMAIIKGMRTNPISNGKLEKPVISPTCSFGQAGINLVTPATSYSLQAFILVHNLTVMRAMFIL